MKLQEIDPMAKNMTWPAFSDAVKTMNERSLYNIRQPGVQEARAGFFNTLKEYSPEYFDRMQRGNTKLNNEVQGIIAIGMEDYKQDPISRRALEQAPFDTQVPLTAEPWEPLPKVQTDTSPFPAAAWSPGGINMSDAKGNDREDVSILLNGQSAINSYSRNSNARNGEPYNYGLEGLIHHENLHTFLPTTGIQGDGWYTTRDNPGSNRENIIPDEEYRVRQLTNAYDKRLGYPQRKDEKTFLNPIDKEASAYFDRAAARVTSPRAIHPRQRGHDFWSTLGDYIP